MARVDTYSRIVLWLKVALPLVALAILSTLFLVAETLDPDAAIPYADVDVGRILENQGVTRPSFGGLTTDGVEVSVGAESVRPDGPRFVGNLLSVVMDFPDGGGHIEVNAPEGTVHMAASEAVLRGGVELTSTSGYHALTETLRATWSKAMLETEGPITASGPLGEIAAGHLILSQDADGTHLLVFNDGVRLVYRPES